MRKVYRHDEIAKLAYELWERRGHPLGSPEIDWYTAESVWAEGVRDSNLPGPRAPGPDSIVLLEE